MDSPFYGVVPHGPDLLAAANGAGEDGGGRVVMQSVTSITSSERIGDKRYYQRGMSYFVVTPLAVGQCAFEIGVSEPTIGEQTVEEQRAIMERYVKSGGRSYGGLERPAFDWRALCNVLGCAVGNWAARGDPTMVGDVGPIEVVDLSERTQALAVGEVVISRAMYRTSGELMALLMFLRASGVNRVYSPDPLPGVNLHAVGGLAAATYCFELFLRIRDAADMCACAGPHELAFSVGLLGVLRVHGHTREGGWWRHFLNTATYPPPCGLIVTISGAPKGWPPQYNPPAVDLLRMAYARALGLCYEITAADRGTVVEGVSVPTMLVVDVDELGQWAAWRGLQDFALEAVDEVVRGLEHTYGLARCSRSAAYAYRGYFDAPRHDDHFAREERVVFPGMYLIVDPLCNTRCRAPCWAPRSSIEQQVSLPLMTNGEVSISKHGIRVNSRGIPQANERFAIHISRTAVGRQGFRLLLSTQFNGPEDGLVLFSRPGFEVANRTSVRPLFHGDGDNLNEESWSMPYTCFPSPVEGVVGDTGVTYIVRSDGRAGFPTPENMSHSTLLIQSSRLAIVRAAPDGQLPQYPSPAPRRTAFAARMMRFERAGAVGEVEFEFDGPARAEVVIDDGVLDLDGRGNAYAGAQPMGAARGPAPRINMPAPGIALPPAQPQGRRNDAVHVAQPAGAAIVEAVQQHAAPRFHGGGRLGGGAAEPRHGGGRGNAGAEAARVGDALRADGHENVEALEHALIEAGVGAPDPGAGPVIQPPGRNDEPPFEFDAEAF